VRVAGEVLDELGDLPLGRGVRGAACRRRGDGEDVRDEGVVALDWDLFGGCGFGLGFGRRVGGREEGSRTFFFWFCRSRRAKSADSSLLFRVSLSLSLSLLLSRSYLGRRGDAEAVAAAVHDDALGKEKNVWRASKESRERERESIDGCSLSSPNASFLSRPRCLLSFPFKKRSLLLSIPLSLFAVIRALFGGGDQRKERRKKEEKKAGALGERKERGERVICFFRLFFLPSSSLDPVSEENILQFFNSAAPRPRLWR
jgi:hypothetical protein